MIEFPEHILPRVKSDVGMSLDPRLLVQEMDIGTRQRRRFSNGVERVQVTWELTRFQWAYLKSFISCRLNEGAETFSISLPSPKGMEEVEKFEAFIVGGSISQTFYVGGVDVSAELELVRPLLLEQFVFDLLEISSNLANIEMFAEAFVDMGEKLSNHLNTLN